MSDIELARRLREGKEFNVKSESMRKRALGAAKILGIQITTSRDGKQFKIQFIK